MTTFKRSLGSTTVIPALVGAGVAAAGIGVTVAGELPAAKPRAEGAAQQSPARAGSPLPDAVPKQVAACGACGAAKTGACGACGACSPCGGAKTGACGACGACSPCGASAGAATECVVESAANPCAAKKGCGAAKAGACGACSPCGAAKSGACGACGPCGASGGVELTGDEAREAYCCAKKAMTEAYAESGNEWAQQYGEWQQYNTVSYASATHGSRYVNNYANAKGDAYGKFEDAGEMPEGAVLAKDSFTVDGQGRVNIGPLFLMEKMEAGFREDSQDWRYTMIMPDGTVAGTTKGENAQAVEFCVGCHMAAQDNDSLMFMPEEVRAGN